MHISGTSQNHGGVDADGSDVQDTFEDSFDSLHADRPTSNKLSGAWTRYGEPGRERAVHNPEIASGGSGWWKEQMLVDRSLRTMAGLTSIFALIMMILSIRYLPELIARKNITSSSVGSQTVQDCGSLEATNVVSGKCWL